VVPGRLQNERDVAYAATVAGVDPDRLRRLAASERLAGRLEDRACGRLRLGPRWPDRGLGHRLAPSTVG
jgi:hypothetical protein